MVLPSLRCGCCHLLYSMSWLIVQSTALFPPIQLFVWLIFLFFFAWKKRHYVFRLNNTNLNVFFKFTRFPLRHSYAIAPKPIQLSIQWSSVFIILPLLLFKKKSKGNKQTNKNFTQPNKRFAILHYKNHISSRFKTFATSRMSELDSLEKSLLIYEELNGSADSR